MASKIFEDGDESDQGNPEVPGDIPIPGEPSPDVSGEPFLNRPPLDDIDGPPWRNEITAFGPEDSPAPRLHQVLAAEVSTASVHAMPVDLVRVTMNAQSEGWLRPSDIQDHVHTLAEGLRAAYWKGGGPPPWREPLSVKRASSLVQALALRHEVDALIEKLSAEHAPLEPIGRKVEALWEALRNKKGDRDTLMALGDLVRELASYVQRGNIAREQAGVLAHGAFMACYPENAARAQPTEFSEMIQIWIAAEAPGPRPSKWKALRALAVKLGLQVGTVETIRREYRQHTCNDIKW